MTALPHEPSPIADDCPPVTYDDLFEAVEQVRPWRSVRQMIQDWWNGR